jgi:hypothetical protein
MAKKVELEAQKQEAIARRAAGVKRVAAKEDEFQQQVATACQTHMIVTLTHILWTSP